MIASALGVAAAPGSTWPRAWSTALRDEAAAARARQLRAPARRASRDSSTRCRGVPGVRVLATSREGLGVARRAHLGGAVARRCPTRRVADELLETDAVRLFVDRARAAQRDFRLDGRERRRGRAALPPPRRHPARHRARGGPGALMSPAEIAARLDERFRLLTGGTPHRGRAPPDVAAGDRLVLRPARPRRARRSDRLGGVRGRVHPRGGRSVVAGDDSTRSTSSTCSRQLVDKSLVVADATSGRTRYRLLETIRQYALERLDDAGDDRRDPRRHATYYRNARGSDRRRD